MSISKENERCIHHYKSSQKILLVGEGDFSFSACLAKAFRNATNMVATSYLNKYSLVHMHRSSVQHLEELEKRGCMLLYEIDVTKMNTHHILKNMKFDVIIYNFPHAGHFNVSETHPDLIRKHRELVEAYFRSASKMLSEGGEVHITHRDDNPYATWDVINLAATAGLRLKEKALFLKSDYPGYHNKRGGGSRTNKTFPIKCAFTFKFTLEVLKKDDVDTVKDQHGESTEKYEIIDEHGDLPKAEQIIHDYC